MMFRPVPSALPASASVPSVPDRCASDQCRVRSSSTAAAMIALPAVSQNRALAGRISSCARDVRGQHAARAIVSRARWEPQRHGRPAGRVPARIGAERRPDELASDSHRASTHDIRRRPATKIRATPAAFGSAWFRCSFRRMVFAHPLLWIPVPRCSLVARRIANRSSLSHVPIPHPPWPSGIARSSAE